MPIGGYVAMALTITVKNDLAKRLRAQAAARKLSVEQWALSILTSAAQSPEDAESWTDLNTRRVALIRRRYETGLSKTQEEELARLQDAAAALLEPFDRRRLEHVQTLVRDADTTNP
jgi:plasmid stability protein